MNAIDPEVVGLHKSKLTDIQIKSKEDAIKSFVGVLDNTANQAMIETTAIGREYQSMTGCVGTQTAL